MLKSVRRIMKNHVTNNSKLYICLLVTFVIGLSAGAFTISGLSPMQREELSKYFEGFLQLYNFQKTEFDKLFKISIIENFKIVALLWMLGVTIIGAPFIFVVILIKGLIIGFSAGFSISVMGIKGVAFIILTLLPREIIIVACLIALCVNGINFSLNIIKNKSIKHITKESLKTNFIAYCTVTAFFSAIIFIAVFGESYTTPILMRIFTKNLT